MGVQRSKLRKMGRVLHRHQWDGLDEWVDSLAALAELSDDEITELERLTQLKDDDFTEN